MKIVFADTSFYVAAASNPRDAHHSKAHSVGRTIRGRVVTTEYVLLEVGTFLCDPPNRPLFLNLVEKLQKHPKTEIVRAGRTFGTAA